MTQLRPPCTCGPPLPAGVACPVCRAWAHARGEVLRTTSTGTPRSQRRLALTDEEICAAIATLAPVRTEALAAHVRVSHTYIRKRLAALAQADRIHIRRQHRARAWYPGPAPVRPPAPRVRIHPADRPRTTPMEHLYHQLAVAGRLSAYGRVTRQDDALAMGLCAMRTTGRLPTERRLRDTYYLPTIATVRRYWGTLDAYHAAIRAVCAEEPRQGHGNAGTGETGAAL